MRIITDYPVCLMADFTTQVDPLRDHAEMAKLIADATKVSIEEASRRLNYEMAHPGRSVADDFAVRGGQRYVAGPPMDAFYGQTNAFIYELAVWNRNRLKHGMRQWIGKQLARVGRPLDVLSIGDGLGFDCLHWARKGHRVTYFELPGQSERFAKLLFEHSQISIPMLTDPKAIPAASFDALTCLDVLEHVPNPPEMVRQLASYLRPGGLMFVSAPFFLILPWYPTHLKASRRYAASLNLYYQAGLKLAGGRPGWDPIVLRKAGGDVPDISSAAQSVAVRLGAALWFPGRFATWPYAVLHALRRFTNREFK